MKRIIAVFIVLLIANGPVFSQKKDTYRVRTVVIDPGHGGAKPGAQGSKSWEKNITLAVAKKFGKLLEDNYPDIKVIYTRTTDVDISLAERAHIANRNKADLFISIHANSHPTATPSGVETFVMGLSESRANLEVAKKENADILLESDYKTNADYSGFDPNAPETYVMLAMFQNAFIDKSLNLAQAIQTQYRQNLKTVNRGVKQAELYVLYKTTCPSVLTEIGFISNPTEEAFMLSEEGQARIAISLFNAFMNYKATEEGTDKIAKPVFNIPGYIDPDKKPAVQVEPSPNEVVEKPTKDPEHKATEAKEISTASTLTVEAQPTKQESIVQTPKEQPAADNSKKTSEQKPAENNNHENEIASSTSPVTDKPLPPETLPAVIQASSTNTPSTITLQAPKHSAAADAPLYYTVQFMIHPVSFAAGDAALGGIDDFQTFSRDGKQVYTTGRFQTYKEATAYCDQVKQATPFKDAWVTRYKAPGKAISSEPASPAPKQTAPATKTAVQTNPNPKQPASSSGVTYRVQFCTATRQMKAGDPDLHGITDFYISRSGKLFIYTAGNYSSLQQAQERRKKIVATTKFSDAFVIALYRGERISLERASQLEKQKK